MKGFIDRKEVLHNKLKKAQYEFFTAMDSLYLETESEESDYEVNFIYEVFNREKGFEIKGNTEGLLSLASTLISVALDKRKSSISEIYYENNGEIKPLKICHINPDDENSL